MDLVLTKGPSGPVRESLFLAYFLLEDCLANVSQVAVPLFGVDGLEERVSIDGIVELYHTYFFLSYSDGKQHSLKIVTDCMTDDGPTAADVVQESLLNLFALAFETI